MGRGKKGRGGRGREEGREEGRESKVRKEGEGGEG